MMLKPSDIVQIPLPYSDLSHQKRRPVLLLTAPDAFGDFTFVQKKIEMNKFIRNFIALLCLILVPLQSIAASPDLVGTYSIMKRGKLAEFIRIESSASGYSLSEKQSGKWRRPIEVNPVSKAQLEKILKQPVTAPFTGLGSKSIAIFQFPKGWTSRKFTCSTGYWLATVLGPIELHKQ